MAKGWRQPLRLPVNMGPEAAADCLADAVHECIHDAVVDLPALWPPRDDACAQQQCEMPRYVGLTGADCLHDLDHAQLTVPKRVQDPKTRRVGEESQPLGHRFEEFLRQSHNYKLI